jgi:hypothetical protein
VDPHNILTVVKFIRICYNGASIAYHCSEILGLGAGAAETTLESGHQLLEKQQAERTEYKTQQAVKAEVNFDAGLIRYEKIIGRGGIRDT